MRIGLIDVDGHNFPNLALMKISAWHKQQGDKVEMVFPMSNYDRVYMAKVFDFTPDFNTCINTREVIKGGIGYSLKGELSKEIENIYPDYSLYNIKNTAYGFLTRGCPRGCPFCIVGEKEGRKSYKVADLDQFWRGQKNIELLDPNVLASEDGVDLLDQLIYSKARVNFNQGLDIRFMNDEVIEKIKQIKIKMIHFAWDRQKDEDKIITNLRAFKAATNIDARKTRVYVLTNYETDFDYDLYRVYKLKELDYDPYIMIYKKEKLPKRHQLRRFQRWVNNKFIFRSCARFEDYK